MTEKHTPDELTQRLREALRFSASRSVMSAAEETAILAAWSRRSVNSQTETKHTPTVVREAVEDHYRAVHGDDMSAEDWYIFEDLHEVAVSRLRNSHTALVAALEGLVALRNRFDETSANYENAYYSFVKGKHAAWDAARAALSAEGEKDAPKDDGWIEWKGGECPVRPDQRVDVRLRSGQECFNDTPDWNWGACAHGGDIIAYRVVKP